MPAAVMCEHAGAERCRRASACRGSSAARRTARSTPSTRPSTPSPGSARDVGRPARTRGRGPRLQHDGLRDRVLRLLLDRRRRGQQRRLGDARSTGRRCRRSTSPRVSVPVLSNATARTRGQPLEAAPPLISTPWRAAPASARHDRHRRRDDQRARAGDDQQHQRAVDPGLDGAAGQRPGRRPRRRRARRPPACTTRAKRSMNCCDRRALGLRLLHQVDDARQRRVVAAAGDATTSAPCAVDRAGEHLVAGRLLHRHRFAGDRRLVDVGAAVRDGAVEREALARADDASAAPGSTRSSGTSRSPP